MRFNLLIREINKNEYDYNLNISKKSQQKMENIGIWH